MTWRTLYRKWINEGNILAELLYVAAFGVIIGGCVGEVGQGSPDLFWASVNGSEETTLTVPLVDLKLLAPLPLSTIRTVAVLLEEFQN